MPSELIHKFMRIDHLPHIWCAGCGNGIIMRDVASGSISLFDLEEELPGIGELDNDAGISTLGGFITDRLDHLPEVNEQIRIRDYVVTVTATDGRRITQTRIQHDPLPSDGQEEDGEDD